MRIKSLLDKNKKSFDNGYYIESINLSYILINKALKQIAKEELNEEDLENKIKTSNLIARIKQGFLTNPLLKTKISKTVIKNIELFNTHYKTISKEIKYQYPQKKDSKPLKLVYIV